MDGLSGHSLRLPPANLEAEQALLGALLANAKAYDRVATFLRADHFADPCHARIYAAIQRRIEAGQLADPVTLRGEFLASGGLEEVGGPAYLGKLLSAMVGIINAGEYAQVIVDAWLRRQLIELGETAVNLAYGAEPELTARDVHARTDAALLALSEAGGHAGGLRDGHAVGQALIGNVQAAVDRGGALPGLTFGLRGLDRMTGGMRRGNFILVAGRPSMGKTSMGLRIAIGAAEAGARVLFVSAEMLSQDILARAACARADLPLTAYTHGATERSGGGFQPLTPDDMNQLADATRQLSALPIMWDDESVTVPAIRARARQMLRKGGLDLIVVDYLGRLRGSEAVQRFGLNSIVTELSAGLKDLAKQLQVPVVVLAQLSRQVEQREDKTPLLSDLRDSGSLEQDADLVIFLYRAHYYLIRSKPAKAAREKLADYEARVHEWQEAVRKAEGKATAIVAKNRQGRIGPVRLGFRDATAEFHDEEPGTGGGD